MTLFYRRLPRFEYVEPHTLEEALQVLGAHREKVKLLAGGTDLVVRLKSREIVIPEYVLNLKSVPGLSSTVTFNPQTGLTIGALATINSVAESADAQQYFPALVQAALSMASPQIRNRGTFVGNICNAVPSADSAPALLALRAMVRIKSLGGERTVPLNEFFTGFRRTVLQPDEMVLDINVPAPPPGSRSVYLKLSPRHSMDLAVVGVAAWGIVNSGICQDVTIALGAVAPTPVRAPLAEAMLKDKKITPELIEEASRNAVTQQLQRQSKRVSQEYRHDMVRVMTKRALTQVLIGG